MLTRRNTLWLLGAASLIGCARPTPGAGRGQPVQQEGFVSAGGIEQWLSIRGASADNPAILFLHGGPGEAKSPFLDEFTPWERSFTVAVWDQRGAGKTYGRSGFTPEDMTLEQLTDDAVVIAEHVRAELGQRKIVVVGHSWGSTLAWNTVRARPDLFHAYVGTGQAVSWARSVEGQETYARAQAEAAGDSAALAVMDQSRQAPFASVARTRGFRPWILPPEDIAYIEKGAEYVGPYVDERMNYIGDEPEGDLANWLRGFGLSGEALNAEIFAFDAYATGPELPVPAVVIQGRDDHITPTAAAAQLVMDLRAPSKAFAEIDGGHFACFTNAEGFAAALERHVLPLIG
jgi:pimeloyl-ACP methyl ester carboxylesterase